MKAVCRRSLFLIFAVLLSAAVLCSCGEKKQPNVKDMSSQSESNSTSTNDSDAQQSKEPEFAITENFIAAVETIGDASYGENFVNSKTAVLNKLAELKIQDTSPVPVKYAPIPDARMGELRDFLIKNAGAPDENNNFGGFYDYLAKVAQNSSTGTAAQPVDKNADLAEIKASVDAVSQKLDNGLNSGTSSILTVILLILVIAIALLCLVYAHSMNKRLNSSTKATKSALEKLSASLNDGAGIQSRTVQDSSSDRSAEEAQRLKKENQMLKEELSRLVSENNYLKVKMQSQSEPRKAETGVKEAAIPSLSSFNDCIRRNGDFTQAGFKPCSADMDYNGCVISAADKAIAKYYYCEDGGDILLMPSRNVTKSTHGQMYGVYFDILGESNNGNYVVEKEARLRKNGSMNGYDVIEKGSVRLQ